MKRMILFSLTVLIVLISGCTAQKERQNNYGQWDQATSEILKDSFNDSLPNANEMSQFGQDYYYTVHQSGFSDYNFVISCSLKYSNYEKFQKELKYLTTASKKIISLNGISYYLIQYSDKTATDYIDDKIYDGMFYRFEIVFADDEALSINVVNAYVWDYYKDEVLIEYLKKIPGQDSTD